MKRTLILSVSFCTLMMYVINCTNVPEALKDYALGAALIISTVSSWFPFCAIWPALFGPGNESYGTSLGYSILSGASSITWYSAKHTIGPEYHSTITVGTQFNIVVGYIYLMHCAIVALPTGNLEPAFSLLDDIGYEVAAITDRFNQSWKSGHIEPLKRLFELWRVLGG